MDPQNHKALHDWGPEMLVPHLADVVQGLDTLAVLGHTAGTIHPVLQSPMRHAQQLLRMELPHLVWPKLHSTGNLKSVLQCQQSKASKMQQNWANLCLSVMHQDRLYLAAGLSCKCHAA